MPVLERSIEIAAPIDAVFDFHLDTRNAAAIAPPEARVVRVEGEFPLREGATVGMWMRPAPIAPAQEWRVRVAELERPTRLVDVAERSPFAEWRHEHLFRTLDEGRTVMTDRVTYRPPLGPLGRIGDRLVMRHLLARTFRIRHERTRAALEGRT
jgi:ligand-binding SRPBCC domain-containing protein